MSDCCCAPQPDHRYRKVLWAALLINALMFAAWPDIAVACVMAVLGLTAARAIIGKARVEMR
jgi:hypothetical protein